MFLIGVSARMWADPLTDKLLQELAPRLADWGFDAIELPVAAPGEWSPEQAAELLGDLGLTGVVRAVPPRRHGLIADDVTSVNAASEHLRWCLRAAGRLGGIVVFSPVFRAPTPDLVSRRATVRRLVAHLRLLADYAAESGTRLAIQPANRYETGLLTTVEQAVDVVRAVKNPAVGLALHTFHMNIEERDLPTAVRTAGAHLSHLQVCANDHGAPGNDHLDWAGIVDALRDVDYAGTLCVEAYATTDPVLAPPVAGASSVDPAVDRLATAGLAFLRGLFAHRPPAGR